MSRRLQRFESVPNASGSTIIYKLWVAKKIRTSHTCFIWTSKINFIEDQFYLERERVIRYKSGDKKTVSRVEDSAVDYWAVHVGGAKNNNKLFYTMIEWL